MAGEGLTAVPAMINKRAAKNVTTCLYLIVQTTRIVGLIILVYVLVYLNGNNAAGRENNIKYAN